MDAMLNGPFGQISLSAADLTIGRAPDNQLVINDTKASSHHAKMSLAGQSYMLTDLGSTNGTFVNEQRLERNLPRPLYNGDMVRIGDTVFSYTVSGAVEIPPTVAAPPPQGDFYSPGTVLAPPPQRGYAPPANISPPQVPPQYPQNPSLPQVPPQYPQQAYPYAPPPYNPALNQTNQTPRKRGRGCLWAILAAVVLLVVVIIGVVALASKAPTPDQTLDTFCSDLKSGDYHSAYKLLSVSAQSQNSEQLFVSTLSTAKVSDCTHGPATTNGNTATATVTVVSALGASVNTATLDKDSNNEWKISDLKKPTGMIPY
ncbi:MAG TPA: FHA domain-containing protein, partial [Ktedonobacteraceae bacterium]|nr:FHA domain-containing protein [Ktedonobacteraceae bacterium]